MKIVKIPHDNDFNALKFFNPVKGEVFVDIGSNRGEAILSMIITSKFNNDIVGFEPNPIVYKKLKKYFTKNNKIELHNVGLANENQEIDLFVPFYRKWMFDGLSSFKYEAAHDWLRTRLWGFNEKKLNIKKIKCPIRKLDSFKLNPYFMKIDVQGYELETLKGGIKTLKAYQPILLIESINMETITFLKQLNYIFYSFKNDKLQEGKGEVNTFCMTKEKYNHLLL